MVMKIIDFLVACFQQSNYQYYKGGKFKEYNEPNSLVKYTAIGIKIIIYSISWIMVLIWDAYEYGMVFYGLILSIYILKYYSRYSCLKCIFEENFRKQILKSILPKSLIEIIE
ncbi:uncharacterized protein ELE39_002606 [Cryptosporidium sp. chipmunk genotype I]|uniref:uncharacterized protein n=1 Tax=Cryptosporidium sp. chipmunk genotype I TaxID=1280935 RepID=UPI00351A7432|nr:hypothetical protein ELE39_002606 [Cryptosporidium sp. chipmunk genotype I]